MKVYNTFANNVYAALHYFLYMINIAQATRLGPARSEGLNRYKRNHASVWVSIISEQRTESNVKSFFLKFVNHT